MKRIFCIYAVLWVLAPTAWADVGPTSVTDDSISLGSAHLEPSDSWFVQAVRVTEDNDGDNLAVTSITLKNNATSPLAEAADIDKIEIYQVSNIAGVSPTQSECAGGSVRGSTTDVAAFNSASGVTIVLANAIVVNGDTDWLCVRVVTKSGLTPGRKILSRFLSVSVLDPVTGAPWSGGTAGTSAAGTFTTKNSGFFENGDATSGLGAGPYSVAPGGTAFVQIIKVRDHESAAKPDANSNALTVNSVTINNLGTATLAGDVATIAVFNCDTNSTCSGSLSLMGSVSGGAGSFPFTIPLLASNTFPADATDRYIGIRVTVNSTSGNTFQLRSVLNVTEGTISAFTGNIDVASDNRTIIEAAGFETLQVLGAFTPPVTITSGASNVAVMRVHAKDGSTAHYDANNHPLKVTSITLGQLGTATLGGDIVNIRIKCSGGGDCDGSTFHVNQNYTASASFPQTFSGLDIDLNDNADVTFEVQVTISSSSTLGTIIQLVFSVSGTEGGSFSQGPVNHSQVTTITSGIGCETLTDLNIGPLTIASGTANVIVQNIMCTDSDGNGLGGKINSITIDNLGDAVGTAGGDIAKIQYGICNDDACSTFTPAGGADSATAPFTFPLTLNGNDINYGSGSTVRVGVRVDVTSTLGRVIQLQTMLSVTEASQTVHQGPVDDGLASNIVGGANQGCEAVSDLEVDAGNMLPGTHAIVQRLICQDSDPDSNGVQITQVNVRNLGTATNADVTKIEIVRTDTNAVVGSTTNLANFGTASGVNISVSVSVLDDSSVDLGVRVFVAANATLGRTIELRTTLKHFEGGQGPFSKSANDTLAEQIAQTALHDTTPPTAQLTSPIGGETLSAQSEFTITWTCTDTLPSSGFGPTAVQLFYSTDGGATFPNEITDGTENDGSFTWSVPDLDAQTVRLRIVCTDLAGNSVEAQSEADFSIKPSLQGPQLSATITAELAACTEGYQPITYTVVITNTSTMSAQPNNPTNEFEIPLVSGTAYIADSATATSGTVAFTSGKITWNGSLAPRASVTITFKVTSSLRSGETISIQGMVFSDRDLNGNNESSEETEKQTLTVVQLGDVNGDGAVNAIDVRLVWLHDQGAAALSGFAAQAADVDCDGQITGEEGDALFIARHALGIPTESGNPEFARRQAPSASLLSFAFAVFLLGAVTLLRDKKRSALLLVLLIGSLGLLTACVDGSPPSPPSGPAVFVDSLLVRRGTSEAFVDIKVQHLIAGGGAVALQGELSYDPKVIQIKSLRGLNGFGVIAQVIDNKSGKLGFVAVKPTLGGVKDGAVARITFSPIGPSNSKTMLSWGPTRALGSDENSALDASFGNAQIRVR